MTIECQRLYEIAENAFHGAGPSFEILFVRAVNRVTSDVNSRCGTNLQFIESASDQLDLEESKYLPVYEDGVLYYMQKTGEFAKKSDRDRGGDYVSSMALAQYHSIEDDSSIKSGYPEEDD